MSVCFLTACLLRCCRLLKSVSHDSKAARRVNMVADGPTTGSLDDILHNVPPALEALLIELAGGALPTDGSPSLLVSILRFFGTADVKASQLREAMQRGQAAAGHRQLALDAARSLIEGLASVRLWLAAVVMVARLFVCCFARVCVCAAVVPPMYMRACLIAGFGLLFDNYLTFF